MPSILGNKGLTTADRSQAEKQELQQMYQGTSVTPTSTPDTVVARPKAIAIDSRRNLQYIADRHTEMANAYQDALADFQEQYHVGDTMPHVDMSDIKDIAAKVSPYYKKYRFTDYIDLDNEDWKRMTAQYEALKSSYGEQAANQFLNNAIQDNVSKNQPVTEKLWNGFVGMGADAAGAIISTAGMLKGIYDYTLGDYEERDYLSGWENFMNSVIDNNWTRFGNDVTKYGTIFNLDEAKEEGLSKLEVVQTSGQQNGTDSFFDQIFNVNTIPLALQQGGFTVASMATGYGEAQAAGWLFKGAKGLTTATRGFGTAESLMATRNLLRGIQKAENFTQKFIIPGLVGTTEGAVEGLSTKLEVEEQGKKWAKEAQQEAVSRRVNEIMSTLNSTTNPETGAITYYDKDGKQVDIQKLYEQVWNEMAPKYDEVLQQVDYAATRAGINNFYINSAINGLINSTFKAALQAPSVQKQLQNSRLFGWAQPRGNFNVAQNTNGSYSVTPTFGVGKQVWQIAKEPLGEFTEEYLQSVSDATMRGGAENNIHQFIDNKYNGDGSALVGETMAGDWAAAWTAFTGSLTDQETLKSGVMGAISSVLGTPTIGRRTVSADGRGTTRFGRGLNAAGERESNWEYIQRVTPWRSGLFNAYNESRRERQEAQETATALEEWLNNPDNKGKFDGLVGTFNWASQMGTSAKFNDEFGYRNSVLGKTINDIFMLQKLEGTEFYNSIMNQLASVANLEQGSEEAQQYIEAMRQNVNTADSSMSDEDILKSLKSNANDMLNTLHKVNQESEKIDQLLGDVDEDTKQALIFGQLSLDDWNERAEQLRGELSQFHTPNTREHSANLTKKQKEILAIYGTYQNAQRALYTLEEQKSSLQEDIKRLSERENGLSDKEKSILKEKKVKLKTVEKQLKALDELSSIPNEGSTVLNEEEIMALDPITRANMILRGKERLYTTIRGEGADQTQETRAHYSPEQQAVIDNLIAEGTAYDRDFLSKIVDLGRIENSRKAFLKQYNAILLDRQSFNHYVQRAKQSAADMLTKKRYESLGNIQNYADFSAEMDKVLTSESPRAQRQIIRALENSGNENYQKYKESRKTLEEMFNKLTMDDKFADMDGNTADMFAHTVTYLTNNGVDLQNEDEVVSALTEADEEGNNKFQKYVEQVNAEVPEEQRTVFTSLGEVIETYKEVLYGVKADREEAARNGRPVEVEVGEEQGIAPHVDATPEGGNPAPGIFGGLAGTTPESGFTNEERAGQRLDINSPTLGENLGESQTPQPTAPEENGQGAHKDAMINSFETNSGAQIAQIAEVALTTVRGSSGTYSNEAKALAESQLGSLSENEFDSVEDLQSAVTALANQLDINNPEDENSRQAAALLRQAVNAMSVAKPADVADTTPKSPIPSIFDRRRQEAAAQNRRMFPNAGPTAGFMVTTDMAYIKEKYPDSPLSKFFEDHHIDDFLRSGAMESNPDIVFLTDDELTNSVKNDMGNKYQEGSMPIVAAVESANGQYEINGKRYQAIGVMPSTNMLYSAGSAHMGRIRDLAKGNSGVSLVTMNGKPITTKARGKMGGVTAKPVDERYTGPNNGIQTLIDADMTPAERQQLSQMSRADRRRSPIYQKIKQRIMKGLRVGTLAKSNTKIPAYFQPNMKDGGGQNIFMFTTSIENTLGRDSSSRITELFGNNDTEGVLNFNSRTKGALREVTKFLTQIPSTKDATGETLTEISGMAKALAKGVGNYLNVSESSGYEFQLTPTDEVNGDERVFRLELVDKNKEKPNIYLADLSKKSDAKAVAYDIMKNLIMDGEHIRNVGNSALTKWQVDYKEIERMAENRNAANNVSDWIDDGILEARATSLSYRIQGVAMETPFKQDGTVRFNPETTNAAPTGPINKPAVGIDQADGNGAIVDGDSGAVLEGKPANVTNEALQTAERKANEIVEDSKTFELTPDGRGYLNKKTGRVHARVTSIIAADESSEGRFDPNSPWVLPSTNIGTSVDELVRDFFAGTVKESYPNGVKTTEFLDQLQALKNNMEAQGFHVIPRDVVAAGTLEIADEKGNIHQIEVAGTLDLLAYDDKGNFYIFDMKTLRNSNSIGQKTHKWSQQTSLYQKFLENNYGIKVKGRYIIPIEVSYPAPSNAGGTTEYTQGEGNQILADGKVYEDAHPSLMHTVSVPFYEPHIQYDKLTDDERGLAENIAQIAKDGGTVEQAPMEAAPSEAQVADPIVPYENPTLGLSMIGEGSNLFEDPLLQGSDPFSMPTRPSVVPTELLWSNLTEAQRQALESQGWNESSWNEIDNDQELEHAKTCLGI